MVYGISKAPLVSSDDNVRIWDPQNPWVKTRRFGMGFRVTSNPAHIPASDRVLESAALLACVAYLSRSCIRSRETPVRVAERLDCFSNQRSDCKDTARLER